MRRTSGTKGEVIWEFKWAAGNDNNIGMGLGRYPHVSCGGFSMVD